MKRCQQIFERLPAANPDPLTLRVFASFLLVCVCEFVCVYFLSSQHILIVQRQLCVLEEELEEFRLALRQYMECSCAQTGCLQSVYILFVPFRSEVYCRPFLICLVSGLALRKTEREIRQEEMYKTQPRSRKCSI